MGAPSETHPLDLRDQHGHAQVLERAAVGVAAEFDPKVVHADDFSKALGPEKIGAAFKKRNDVMNSAIFGRIHSLLAPHTPRIFFVAHVALFKNLFPARGAAAFQRLEVVLHLQSNGSGGIDTRWSSAGKFRRTPG